MSAVHDCLFNLFAATLHIGGRSSIRNLRMRHAYNYYDDEILFDQVKYVFACYFYKFAVHSLRFYKAL